MQCGSLPEEIRGPITFILTSVRCFAVQLSSPALHNLTDNSESVGALIPFILRLTASHLNSQSAAFVEVPQLDELLRHGVEPLTGQDVVIVMVADGLPIQCDGERPKAVNCHLIAHPQGQADQEEARREALGMNAACFPEFAYVAQEVRVGEEHGEVGGGVCDGVVRPERWVGAGLHGERWHVDEAGAVCLQIVQESFSRPEKTLESEEQGELL